MCTYSYPTSYFVSELSWKTRFSISCLLLCLLVLSAYVVFRKLKGAEKKPMSPQTKYDVFVSFRGEDIRSGFLSHLIDTFERNKINAFVDDKLERGDEIWKSLVGAIEGSSISLVIFSQGYASSRWCLEELVTILACKEKYGRIVIPIFYHVNPTNVRHQTGSYQNAFAEIRNKSKTHVRKWRRALTESADLSGIESSKFRNDVELLTRIVKLVLTRLGESSINSKKLVGIDEKIAEIESLIRKEPNKTRLIGIWGMGGIGKTTLVNEILIKLRSEYEGCYFLANEREQSSRHGILSLREEIFSGLLADVVKIDTTSSLPNDIDRRIRCMKVLIVLDDVNDSDHPVKLLGIPDNFGSGSRIIITTRDKQVLNANKVHEIYRLGGLSSDKALEFFKLNAFNPSDHQWEYDELSKRVVDYAKGIPLILEVLAHLLCGKGKEVWESQLDKLKRMPLIKVYDVMKLSYDVLDPKEQQIFLDLACFFLRSHMMVDKRYLKYLLKDTESDNSVIIGLDRLKDKSLIIIFEDALVFMHDTLQEMAWEIVRRQSSEGPGSHSRLWDPDDVYEALENDKAIEAIRSIQIHFPTFNKQKLSPHIFAKMKKLRFLEISGRCNYDCFDQHNTYSGGLQSLATELRFICWYYYPLQSLPENFSAENLVILKLPQGRIKNLWHGVKNLVNLKKVDLSGCTKLEELPDLSKATNLEELLLRSCSMLTRVHPSIFSLSKLEKLNLEYCKSLTKLSSDSHLCSLSYLNLDWCSNLREFSLISENMSELSLQGTKVKAFPSSFGHQSKLKSLFLRGSDIKRLPSSIKNFMQLLHLNVSYCEKLQTIPELPPFLETLDTKCCDSLKTLPKLPPSLKTLKVEGCHFQTLPVLPNFLETLDTQYCTSLQTLPELPLSLKILCVSSCSSLLTLPDLPYYLEKLDTNSCTSLQTLPELPPFLIILRAQNCTSLKTVLLFPSTAYEQLKENRKQVLFWNCLNLDQHSLVAIELNAQINVMNFANRILYTPNHDDVENYNYYDKIYHSYQVVYVYPGSSVPEWLEYKTINDHITIDLSSTSPPLVGFIFCFVLGKYVDGKLGKIEANISISDDEGESKSDSVIMYLEWLVNIESDNVCVMYDERCSAFLYSRAENPTRFKIHVTMMIRKEPKEIVLLPQQMFKGFGVSPISTSTYSSFIQQMKSRDLMYLFH